MGLLGRADPRITLAVLPLSLSFCLLLYVIENARAVLEIVFPLADVSVAGGKVMGAFSMSFASLEFAIIS